MDTQTQRASLVGRGLPGLVGRRRSGPRRNRHVEVDIVVRIAESAARSQFGPERSSLGGRGRHPFDGQLVVEDLDRLADRDENSTHTGDGDVVNEPVVP